MHISRDAAHSVELKRRLRSSGRLLVAQWLNASMLGELFLFQWCSLSFSFDFQAIERMSLIPQANTCSASNVVLFVSISSFYFEIAPMC
jgi:hypothetical protein